MQISRIALGSVRRRGADVLPPSLVAFGPTEVDFLVRHVERVRHVAQGGRSAFVAGSATPATLASMAVGTDSEFLAGAELLQQSLARAMGQVARASDCVLAVVQAVEPARAPGHLTLLKLDAVVEAARVRIEHGVVNLQVLRELVPEPGALRKALSWPDPRPDSDVLMIDTNTSNAQYFEDAYQVRVSPKSAQAEAELQTAIVRAVPQADHARALADANTMGGPAHEVLDALADTYPSLRPAARAAAADPRPSGIIRAQRVAARPVVWRADGVELRVPADRAGDVRSVQGPDGWTLSIRVDSEPQPGQ